MINYTGLLITQKCPTCGERLVIKSQKAISEQPCYDITQVKCVCVTMGCDNTDVVTAILGEASEEGQVELAYSGNWKVVEAIIKMRLKDIESLEIILEEVK